MEDKLKEIFENVNGWLKVAESKNGALVIADLAIAVGLLQLIKGVDDPNAFWMCYAYIAIVLSLISAAVCLTSFVPQLRMPWFTGRGDPSHDDNLLFFGHIAKYPPGNYLQRLYRLRNEQPPENLSEFELDYAEQIVTNSRIAQRKYDTFSIGAWLTIAAVATPLIAVILWAINKNAMSQRPDN